MTTTSYDVIIIGGGPGGATAGLVLARAGIRTLILEKARFPRFHIGESILPRNFPLIQELGLEKALKQLPHLDKYGAEFGIGNDPNTTRFTFDQGLEPGSITFNIERAFFDKMLLEQAEAAGAEVRQNTAVTEILQLRDGAVSVKAGNETISARWLLDASGHGTVVGRHLGIRKNMTDPQLQKVAYFAHFDNVWRWPGKEDGHPTIIMCKEGWFWLIGLNAQRTSIGFVTSPRLVKELNIPANQVLKWAIARCPVVRQRMEKATGPDVNEVLADFSYTCKPIAGPGYFMVGDAGAFLDPIFSTGVTLSMLGAVQAARHTIALLRNSADPNAARRQYIRYVEGGTGVLWRLIRNYYHHSFRELFMQGTGPLQVHRAVISILAGQVFPRPSFALRWRMRLFELCMHTNKFIRLVPRRPEFSLLANGAV